MVLVPLGVRVARRTGTASMAWLRVLVAASMTVPHLFLISYSAPRFLLPTYALALVPAASGLVALLAAAPGNWRRPLAALVAVGFTGHLVIQAGIVRHVVSQQVRGREDWTSTARTLRSHGVRPPCVISGHEAIPVAYYTGCRALEDRGNNRNASTTQLREAATAGPFALLTKGTTPPDWAADWHRVPVPDLNSSGWTLYLPTMTPGSPN